MEDWLANPVLLEPDSDAQYAEIIEVDLNEIKEPLLACPNDPDDIKSLSELQVCAQGMHWHIGKMLCWTPRMCQRLPDWSPVLGPKNEFFCVNVFWPQCMWFGVFFCLSCFGGWTPHPHNWEGHGAGVFFLFFLVFLDDFVLQELTATLYSALHPLATLPCMINKKTRIALRRKR